MLGAWTHHEQPDVFTVISPHIVGMCALVLVIGALIDRVGRRPSLISGLAIIAVSAVMLAWVESIAWTSLSLFLLGLGSSGAKERWDRPIRQPGLPASREPSAQAEVELRAAT